MRLRPFAEPAVIAVAGCSDSSDQGSMTCDEMLERIAEIESTAASGGQSWDTVQENAELAIERDALRVEVAVRSC